MKTKILKMILPVFVLMLAVVSAFAFKNAENKALLTFESGWLDIPGNPCNIEVECDNSPSDFICTAFHNNVEYQAYGKVIPNSLVCDKVLYMPRTRN